MPFLQGLDGRIPLIFAGKGDRGTLILPFVGIYSLVDSKRRRWKYAVPPPSRFLKGYVAAIIPSNRFLILARTRSTPRS